MRQPALLALLIAASSLPGLQAQTSQVVYSQNFNSAANGTTGTGLGDGSNMADNTGVFNVSVFSSTQWGSGVTPDGQTWKALWLTPMNTGIVGNFYMPVVNQGQAVSAFSASFTLLNNYSYRTTEHMADGFSINFGKFNDTSNAYGGEWGMYSPGDGKTGDVLTLAFYTYTAADPRIELRYNGNTIATNAMDPYWNNQAPSPASAFLPVNFSWDANGVDVTYFGTTVFSNVAVAGFAPGVGYRFAMAARTGASVQNTFVDDIAISTTAAPFVWTSGSGNWTTAGGWAVGAAPTTNNNWIVMKGAGGAANNNAVTAVQGLVFDSAASGSYTLSGNAVTVGADGIVNNSASAQTISSNLTLGASQTFGAAAGALTVSGAIALGGNALNVNATQAVALGGAISGTGSLAKSGNATLTLSGSNNYTGGTTVSAGTLAGDATSLQGAITNNATVSFAQSASGTYSGRMSGSGVLAKSGAGDLTLTNSNTYSGGTTLSAGAIRVGHNAALGSGAVTLNGGALSSDSSSARTLANNLTLGADVTLGHATNNGALSVSGTVGLGGGTRTLTIASDVTLGGVVSNGGLAKSGAGRLTLDAANTYTGATTVNAGTLALGASGALDTSTVVSVASGATFDLNGRTQTVAGLHGAGAVQLGSGSLTVIDGSNRTLSGSISGTGSLSKSGAGDLTLAASNSHSGGTTLSAGAIRVGHNAALGSGAVTLNGGALSSDSSSARTLANNLTLGADVTLGHATNNGALSVSGTVGLGGANRTLTIASDVTLGGVVSNGSLTKTGAGTLTLDAANDYTGATTVSTGVLALGASGSIASSSAIHVASGSTLDVSANSGFTLASGQTLSGGGTVVGDAVIAGAHTPGFSPGLQTFDGNLTYANGSSVTWELAANSLDGRGTGFDGIDVQGDLTFQGAVALNLSFSYVPGTVDWTSAFWDTAVEGLAGWKIFGATGTVNGFANLQIANAEWLDANGMAFATARPYGSFSLYQGVDGVYLNYTPVPEPSTYGLLLGALALAGAAVRRRKVSK